MSTPARKVICKTDGQVFPSAKEAAKFYGLTSHDITKTASGQQKTTHGLKFEYVPETETVAKTVENLIKTIDEEAKKYKEEGKADKVVVPVDIQLPDIIEYRTLKLFGITVWSRTRRVTVEKMGNGDI